ncbi:MAG: hypothetical protein Q9180_008949, partial [Flavoplaca navasiana]
RNLMMVLPDLAPKMDFDHRGAIVPRKHQREHNDDVIKSKTSRRRRPVPRVQSSSAGKSSQIKYPANFGNDQIGLLFPPTEKRILVYKRPLVSIHRQSVECAEAHLEAGAACCNALPWFRLQPRRELGMLILEIEAASDFSDLEGLAEFRLVKAVRREAKLQVDERPSEDSNAENPREGKLKKDKLQGYKYAWIQSLNNHVFVLARMRLPIITRMSM